MRTRASTSTRFNFKFLRVFSNKKTPRKASFYVFSPKKLVQLITLKEIKPSPDSKMIKLLTLAHAAHARALLSTEKISYEQLSLSSNLKLSNNMEKNRLGKEGVPARRVTLTFC